MPELTFFHMDNNDITLFYKEKGSPETKKICCQNVMNEQNLKEYEEALPWEFPPFVLDLFQKFLNESRNS